MNLPFCQKESPNEENICLLKRTKYSVNFIPLIKTRIIILILFVKKCLGLVELHDCVDSTCSPEILFKKIENPDISPDDQETIQNCIGMAHLGVHRIFN